jgi:hypothetical protein
VQVFVAEKWQFSDFSGHLGGYFGGGGKRFTALCPVKFPQKQIFLYTILWQFKTTSPEIKFLY